MKVGGVVVAEVGVVTIRAEAPVAKDSEGDAARRALGSSQDREGQESSDAQSSRHDDGDC